MYRKDFTNNVLFGNAVGGTYGNFRDKQAGVNYYITKTLRQTASMFEYDGLPETMPRKDIERYLQTNGYIAIAKHNGELYGFFGGIGGEYSPYYLPTKIVVANPALNLSKEFTVDKDCVLIPNDSYYQGLIPIIERYASLMVDNDLTLRLATINSRMQNIIDANDDNKKKSATLFIDDIEAGKLAIVGGKTMTDGIKTLPFGATSNGAILQNIELKQYLKASLLNELGLNANWNAKREAIGAGESSMQNDSLIPLIDDMLRMRQEGFDKVNKMFGTNISVRLNSSWQKNATVLEQEIEAAELTVEEPKDAKEGEGNDA